MGMYETGKWRPTFSDIVTVAALFGAAVMWFAPPNWEVGLPVVLLTAAAVIFTAFRHQSHPLLRGAIGAVALIALISVAWHPIWKDFQEKHPAFANTITLRSTVQGPKLEAKVLLTILGEAVINGRMTPGSLIIMSVTNTGSVPTIAKNYRVSVSKDGNIYQGVVLGSPETFKMLPLLPEDKFGPIQFFGADALYNKTATPLAPGAEVYGFLQVSYPTVSDYSALKGGYLINILFEDAFSNGWFDIAIPSVSPTTDFRSAMRVYPGMHTVFPAK